MDGGLHSRRTFLSFSALVGMGAAALVALGYLGQSLARSFAGASLAVTCPWFFAMTKGHLSSGPPAIFPWVGFGLLLTGALNALFHAGRRLCFVKGIRNRLFLIPAEDCPRLNRIWRKWGLDFGLYRFQGEFVESAFTMGFWRPKVYISAGLCQRLSDRELEGVILHEAHHVRRRDPLRQFLVAFVRDFLFFLPLGGILEDIFAEAKEKAADDAAVDGLQRPLELASALIKLAAGPGPVAAPGIAGLTGRGDLTVRRIERLLGEEREGWTGFPPAAVFGTWAVGYLFFVCV